MVGWKIVVGGGGGGFMVWCVFVIEMGDNYYKLLYMYYYDVR